MSGCKQVKPGTRHEHDKQRRLILLHVCLTVFPLPIFIAVLYLLAILRKNHGWVQKRNEKAVLFLQQHHTRWVQEVHPAMHMSRVATSMPVPMPVRRRRTNTMDGLWTSFCPATAGMVPEWIVSISTESGVGAEEWEVHAVSEDEDALIDLCSL